jgi:hypothetical protein
MLSPADRNLLPLYVWYVRRRPRDVLIKLAQRRLGALRLAYVPSPAIALKGGRQLLLSFQIGGENGSRFAVGGIVLA